MRRQLFILVGLLFGLVLAVSWSGSGRAAEAQPAAVDTIPAADAVQQAVPSRPLMHMRSAGLLSIGITSLVSVASDGTQGNDGSLYPSISADGRYVAFYSSASNLVPGDTNNMYDIFVHDRQTGQTSLVSVASDGTQGNSWSSYPSISADGRYVAFDSSASNLVPGDTNNVRDIFVHDRQTGQTSRVSVASDGTQGNDPSSHPSISADGRYVAFVSFASNLVPGDTNTHWDVFVHDRQTGTTSRVSAASNGTQGNEWSYSPSISADGRYVAFESHASNLVPGDTNDARDVFVHDRQTGTTSRVSVASDGTQGNSWSFLPSISADGRYVAFDSPASNLVPGDTNGINDVFVHDRQTGQTSRVSVASDGTQGISGSERPSISADGRYVAFESPASNLVPGDTNDERDVFVHDRQTGQTSRVSVASDGTQGNDWSSHPSISADGRYVAFSSWASNLVPGDTNTHWDVFVHDRLGVGGGTYSIAGRITEGNNVPIVGAVVSTNVGQSATTDGNGDYTITGLITGTYTLTPSKAGYTFSPPSRAVTVPPTVAGQNFTGIASGTGCSQANPNRQPLLFVTGWSGSRPTATEDDQLRYFFGDDGHLAPYGYIEGCNLFYAEATSPYLWLDENAEVIRDNLCLAYLQVKSFNSNWNGHFDIIAHSYGGLRARAYLENESLYGQNCGGSQNRVYVDNLFTLGTPHGGEPYPLPTSILPFAFVIGLGAVGDLELPALGEMHPATRLAQNLSSSQPAGVCYYLLSGDGRQQSDQFPQKLALLGLPFPSYHLTVNDLAVHDASATVLDAIPYRWLYPRTIPIHTDDLHGQVPEDMVGPHSLRSFVNPNATFVQEIWPHVGQSSCFAEAPVGQPLGEEPTVLELLARQTEPQSAPAMPLMDVTNGTLSDNESVSGEFFLSGTGSSQIMLSWPSGDLSLILVDPNGNPVTPETAETDPNIDYLSLDTGFGLMATYLITDTVNGYWQYTITGNQVSPAAAYRLVALPPTPIAVAPSVPQWLPNNTPVVITATVSYSATTPISGGTVTAQIQHPDGGTDTVPLYDDGAHHDGPANDGTFGGSYPQTESGGIYGVLVTASGLYAGETFTRTATAYFAVAPAGAALNDQYSDTGIDEDNDGIYDWLQVTAGLSVTEVGTYTLSAELYAGDTFISHTRTQVSLQPGNQNIALRFAGTDIFASGLDGPYTVRNVLLLDESDVTLLIEMADNVHTTAAYSYRQFGTFSLFIPIVLKP